VEAKLNILQQSANPILDLLLTERPLQFLAVPDVATEARPELLQRAKGTHSGMVLGHSGRSAAEEQEEYRHRFASR